VDDSSGLLWLLLAGGVLFFIVIGVSCYLWNPFRMKEPEPRPSRTASLRNLAVTIKPYDELN
jgi:hypothetical protein